MPNIIKQLKDFRQGMSPFINSDGIARIEHFDVTTNQLKPYRGIALSGHDNSIDGMYKVVKANGVTGATETLFALTNNYGDTRFVIMKWNVSLQEWRSYKSSASTSEYEKVMHYYNGYFIGLRLGTHLWRVNNSAVELTHQALSFSANHNVSDFLTHSKDGLCYIPTDNKLASYNGTTVSQAVLTLPSTFIIKSIAEEGDYIGIVGYDSEAIRSTYYLWDRDSSLATLTAKHDLGMARAEHNATLGGVHFIVSNTMDNDNTSWSDEQTLIIGYISSTGYKVKSKYKFGSIDIGGKYIDGDNLYFLATVRFTNELTAHNVLFRLNASGNLFIEQNLGVSSATIATGTGLVKDGDGFWFGLGSGIGYHTHEAYDTTSIIEINPYEADKLTDNIDTIGVAVSFDPLPSGASVTVKTKADEETDWTTVGTFDTDNAVKGSITGSDISTAKTRQFRLESAGGAVINAFQADLETKNDELYN